MGFPRQMTSHHSNLALYLVIFVDGRCGLLKLLITEIVYNNVFFDFERVLI